MKHHVNNYIVYQTYEVEVHYKLKFPWKFIFDDERIYIPMVARAEVPVTDSPEFIRNVDMAVDMLERSEGGEYFFANADTIYGKVRDFLNGESPTGEPVSGKLKVNNGKTELMSSLPDPPPDAAKLNTITVNFKCKEGLDAEEFKRQLTNQQDGMNRLTLQEYLDNREAYNANKRDPQSNKYQQQARKEAQAKKEQDLIKDGKTPEEAKKEAEAWMKTQAALHDPDQVAGGYANVIGGVGDLEVNRYIGTQWKTNVK